MANIAYPLLLVAAVLLVALPRLSSQSMPPAPSPQFPQAAPGPYMMAPSPALDCLPYFYNMSDCLSFVTPGSNVTQPDPACCPEFSQLVQTQPICLCHLLGNTSEVPIPVDINRGQQLPSVCNVTTPPVSTCAALGFPIPPSSSPSPSEAEGPSPTSSPSDTEVASPTSGGSGGGSVAASPSPRSQDDDGSPSNSASKKHFLIGLAAALLMYFF